MTRYLGLLTLLLLGLPLTAQAGTTLHDAVTANATGKNLSVADKGAVGIAVTIAGAATVTFQGSTDQGVTWNAIFCTQLGGTTVVTTATATGQFQCSTAGLTHVQAPVSGCAGCTVTVQAQSSMPSTGGGGGSADTELPAATAIAADNQAAPTAPGVYSYLMCYDGATWDRCLGGLTDTDDGTIVTGQVPNLGINLIYCYDGTNWVRCRLATGATGAAPPGHTNYVAGLGSGATGGFLTAPTVCDSYANINIVTATTTLMVTGVSGRHVRICSLSMLTTLANNVAFISGTGATCGTGTTGMTGGTTAATGYNLPIAGNIQYGGGLGAINQTNATGDSVCIITSIATQLSGRIAYAIY